MGEGDPHGKRGVRFGTRVDRELVHLVVVVAVVVLVAFVFVFLPDFCVCELFCVQQVGRREGEARI